ncbi:MAG: nucleotide exchange factor GrpE [Myxococcales bacterium]|nr:nucleotide exchange factor GrpE [Myxococcales bacterium]
MINDPDELDFEAVALSGPEIPRSASGPHDVDAADPSGLNAHLLIEMDPDLEAALAAWDNHRPARTGRADPASPPGPSGTAAPPTPRRLDPLDPRILTLNARVREQGERLAGLEEELRRVSEGRALAESQLSEMRTTLRAHSEDFDRFRQRSHKDRIDAEKVGEKRILRSFLETANNVERAWQHAETHQGQLLTGLQMIVEQFRATLRKAGLERIPATPGSLFDPEMHEAVLRVPSADHAPGRVVDEASPGWRLHGRLLMAARVTVADAGPITQLVELGATGASEPAPSTASELIENAEQPSQKTKE